MVLQRFRERTNRYTRTHNTPTQQLNNAASLSSLLPPWPLSSLQAVWKTILVLQNYRVLNNSFCKCVSKLLLFTFPLLKSFFISLQITWRTWFNIFCGCNASVVPNRHFQCVQCTHGFHSAISGVSMIKLDLHVEVLHSFGSSRSRRLVAQ